MKIRRQYDEWQMNGPQSSPHASGPKPLLFIYSLESMIGALVREWKNLNIFGASYNLLLRSYFSEQKLDLRSNLLGNTPRFASFHRAFLLNQCGPSYHKKYFLTKCLHRLDVDL
jgi:hypothetical protein